VAFYDKYTGILRRLKIVYAINNLWNYKYLKRNKSLYDKYGISREVWQSISSKHFDTLSPVSDLIPGDEKWDKDGYLHIKGHYSVEFVDSVNDAMKIALDNEEIAFNYTGKKVLFAYEKVAVLKDIINDKKLGELLESLTKEKIVPFQSINFQYGSEQAAHSDSVHMATYPVGGLIAIWVALDDIDEDNGPLFYYPGSHKLPYASNADMGNATGAVLSPNPNKNYEEYQAAEIKKHNLKAEVLSAKKGDVFVWHANLLHGGMPHTNTAKTRRSIVVHYFVKDRICYHELSQRPAVVKEI
jgi:hypothetical protein